MAKYRGKEVKLNKPFRLSTGESKKFWCLCQEIKKLVMLRK